MQLIFLSLVALVALQRILEMRKSRIHEFNLQMRGAQEFAPEHFKWMRLIHIFWLIGCVVESFFISSVSNTLLACGVTLFILGQIFRWLAIETLGPRWTVRIFVLPGEPLVKKGIYKYIRHPNYLGVAQELAGLPLIGGCVVTSVGTTLANLLLLKVRIKFEEQALQDALALRYDSP